MQQNSIAQIRSRIARMQELLILLLVCFHPIYGTHREAICHGDDRQFILAGAFPVHSDCGARRALIKRVLERILQFVGKPF